MQEPVFLREYETIYILRPELTDEGIEKLNGRVKEVLDRGEARLLRHEVWGKKKLAYEVKKNQKGVFVFVQYLAGNAMVAELERNLRMWDDVIKYQTVKLADEVDAEARMQQIPPAEEASSTSGGQSEESASSAEEEYEEED